MSFLFCNKQKINEQKLNGSVFIKKIQSINSEIPNNCDTYSEKINIPSSISGNKNLVDGEIFEYCIPFQTEIQFSNDSKAGLSLGYIDNLPMVYLNGKLIYSYNPNSIDHIFYYEKELFFEIDSNLISKNNISIRKKIDENNNIIRKKIDENNINTNIKLDELFYRVDKLISLNNKISLNRGDIYKDINI